MRFPALLFYFLLDELELGFHFFEKFLFLGEAVASFFDELFWCFTDIVWAVEALFKGDDFLTHLENAAFEVGFVLFVNILWDLEVNVVVMNG